MSQKHIAVSACASFTHLPTHDITNEEEERGGKYEASIGEIAARDGVGKAALKEAEGGREGEAIVKEAEGARVGIK